MNLIVDLSYCFHMDFHPLSKVKNPLSTQSGKNQLAKSVATRIFSVVETLPIENVILCNDAKSWRKEFYTGYKKSREVKKDGSKGSMDEKTLKEFYNTIDDFCNAVKTKGIIISKVPGAEGDDLLYLWSKHFNDNGKNCLIMSGDRDSVQLVSPATENKGWTIVWTNSWKNQTFFVPNGWTNKKLDIFEISNTMDETSIQTLSNNLFATITEMTDPSSIVLNKILLGDDGDDIPAVWDNGEKRLTPKKSELVIDYIKNKGLSIGAWPIISKDDNLLNELSGAILRTMNAIDGVAERSDVIKNFRRNEKLVWIEKNMLPEVLVNEFDRHQSEAIIESNSYRDPSNWRRNTILSGTKLDGYAASKEHDPFAFMDLPI